MMKTKIAKVIVLFLVVVVIGFTFSLKKNKEYLIQNKSISSEMLVSNLGIIADKLSKKVEDFAGSSGEIVSEEKTDTIAQSYEDSAKIIVEENRQMIVEFLREFPKEASYKWFDIFYFDFNFLRTFLYQDC